MGCLHLVSQESPPLPVFDTELASVVPPASALVVGTPVQPMITTGVVASATGCMLVYRLYRPQGEDTRDLVVLGHGFLRTQDRMADLARHLADAGVATVTLDFCNARLWDGRHVRNGFDMIKVADALEARRVVYTGFSAGGLAALVAGRNDPRTVGVVTLDLVDADRIGEKMAAGLDRPLIGLVGDPSPCNANNNGLAVFAASAEAAFERVSGAEHCDFESPTDWLCRLICRRQAPNASSPRRDIMDAATSATVALLGD
jgi:pimeloyl-ACP methyl ester carboxylesterase